MKHFLLLMVLSITAALSAQNQPKANLYPNPASEFVKVTFTELIHSDVTFTISDILGNKIETYSFKQGESIYVDLSTLKLLNGIYLIKIEAGDSIFLKRLIIKNM